MEGGSIPSFYVREEPRLDWKAWFNDFREGGFHSL